MNEFVVYILYSKTHNLIYKGYTSNLIARFKDHNELGKKGWSHKYRPWQVVHVEVYKSKGMAQKREAFFKTGAGREWISKNVIIG
ncbi:MAG: GIY-YIG nuclease family protein [Gelidibacter sp.]